MGETSGDSGREGSVSGLLLGRGGRQRSVAAAIAFPLHPGAPHTAKCPEPQHHASLWSSPALVLVGAGR